jgi:hypothetical protein
MTSIALAAGLTAFALAVPLATGEDRAGTPVVVRLTDSQATMTPGRVPVGPVLLRIVNRGRTTRTFVLGHARTPPIRPGSSVTLHTLLSTRGPHRYVSVGRQGARVSGVLDAFVPCLEPQASTIDVRMDHDRSGITLSQTAIPCGTVTLVVTNAGSMTDSLEVFADYPRARGSTPELDPGQSARLTIHFTEKGIAYYQSGDYPPGEPEFGGGDADGGLLTIV